MYQDKYSSTGGDTKRSVKSLISNVVLYFVCCFIYLISFVVNLIWCFTEFDDSEVGSKYWYANT